MLAGAALFACAGLALAAERGTGDEAVAMVKKAQAFVRASGKDKALAEFSNPQGTFKDRDLYVFVLDRTGNTLAHGGNPKLIGKAMIDLKDADGKLFIKAIVDTAFGAAGKVWVDYKWPNPVSKAVEPKSTYVEKYDDMLIGVGIYK
jgi:cytochrome c